MRNRTADSRIGKTFGNLTIRSIERRDKRVWGNCDCSCGAVCKKRLDGIISGKIVACSTACTRKHNNNLFLFDTNPAWKGCGRLSHTFFSEIRRNADRRRVVFDVNIEYLWEIFEKQDGRCALTDISLSFGDHSRSYNRTASLDRIDSEKGYVKENVQWVHKEINIIKGSLKEDIFVEWCKKVANHRT